MAQVREVWALGERDDALVVDLGVPQREVLEAEERVVVCEPGDGLIADVWRVGQREVREAVEATVVDEASRGVRLGEGPREVQVRELLERAVLAERGGAFVTQTRAAEVEVREVGKVSLFGEVLDVFVAQPVEVECGDVCHEW